MNTLLAKMNATRPLVLLGFLWIWAVAGWAGDAPATPDRATTASAAMSNKLTTEGLARFDAQPGIVRLSWTTHSEENNFGFNIRRGKNRDGEFEKINPQVILGAGNSSTENTYEYFDENVKVGEVYYYYIEDITLDGVTTEFSPRLRKQVDRINLAKITVKPAGEDGATTGVCPLSATSLTSGTCPLFYDTATTAASATTSTTCPLKACCATSGSCPLLKAKPAACGKDKAEKTAARANP